MPPDTTVFFSAPLTPAVLNPANWFVRDGNFWRTTLTAVAAAPNVVTLTEVGFAPNIGPDIVTYTPPPFDVTGPTGIVAAFADFPLT